MKIRTIIGLLLVLALVIGSTGIGAADGDGIPDEEGDGEPDQIQDQLHLDWIDDLPPGDGDGVCNN
jgi:hypothetical protein